MGERTINTQGESTDLKRSLTLKLTVIGRLIRMRFDESAERAGVTRALWTLTAAVARSPGATQKTLANMLQISEVSTGRLIDKLCGEGLIVRRTDDSDRRAYRVYLTDAAKPVLKELGDIARDNENRVFAGMTEADLAELDRLLDLLHRNTSPNQGPLSWLQELKQPDQRG